MRDKVRRAIGWLKNTDADISIRLFYVAGYALLFACILGTIGMLVFTTTSFSTLIPNIVLILFVATGLFISHHSKNYELAADLLIVGCGFIALPVMFFTAGGNHSGMMIWFLFGVVFTYVLAKGKSRVIMPTIMITLSLGSMLIGYFYPNLVNGLESEDAEFFDAFQSFLIVSVMLLLTLRTYFSTYDRQREMLEEQSEELKRMVYADSLTGIKNRQAYYEKINSFKDDSFRKNLVIIAMDVNGLKQINDTEGHAAGDAFIKCAADCVVNAFVKFGDVYRTGGDEFMAVLFCEDDRIDQLPEMLKNAISSSSDKFAKNMTIALGLAAWNREKDKNFFELEKLADARMYQDKNQHYIDCGIDRRNHF